VTIGLAITLVMLALTFGWITYDLSRPSRILPPLVPLITGNGKHVLDSVNEAERLFVQKTVELDELRQKAGIFRTASDLRRADDHMPGTDTSVVKAIDMKLAIARAMAERKKA
jgi:hypothetical protein